MIAQAGEFFDIYWKLIYSVARQAGIGGYEDLRGFSGKSSFELT